MQLHATTVTKLFAKTAVWFLLCGISVTGSIQLNKLLCWNQHRLSLNRRQPRF